MNIASSTRRNPAGNPSANQNLNTKAAVPPGHDPPIKDTYRPSPKALVLRDAFFAPLPGVGMMMNLDTWIKADASRDSELSSAMMTSFLGAGANLVGSASLIGGFFAQSPEAMTLGAVSLLFGSLTAVSGRSQLRAAGIR